MQEIADSGLAATTQRGTFPEASQVPV